MAGQGSAERVILGNRGQRVWAFMHAGLWVNTSYLGMWKKNLKKIWRIAPWGIDGYDATWVELMAVICTKWRWADRKEGCVEVMIIRWERTHTHTERCWHRQAQGMHDSAGAGVQSVCNGDMLNVQLVLTLLFWRIFQKKDKGSLDIMASPPPFVKNHEQWSQVKWSHHYLYSTFYTIQIVSK